MISISRVDLNENILTIKNWNCDGVVLEIYFELHIPMTTGVIVGQGTILYTRDSQFKPNIETVKIENSNKQ